MQEQWSRKRRGAGSENERRLLIRVACIALATFALAGGAASAAELGPGVEEVRDCMERNVPRSTRQTVSLERTDRTGGKRRLEAELVAKLDANDRARFLARIEEPPDQRGSAFLFLDQEGTDDMFTYLPELRTVRRITSRSVSGSFFGTDLSYEDVLELQAEAEHARIERLPDAELDGRPVYVLVATPGADSRYERVVSRIDRETCVLLAVDLYVHGDKLAKQITVPFADVERHGERWIPKRVRARDLDKGSETVVVVEKAEWDVEVPDRLFNQSELAKGR